MVHIVVAARSPLVRAGIAAALAPHDDLRIVGQAADGREAISATTDLQPDVLLLDSSVEGCGVLDVLTELRARDFATRVLILAVSMPNDDRIRAVELGVHGLVPDDGSAERLVTSLRAVARGEHWFDQAVVSDLVNVSPNGPAREGAIPRVRVTPRERKVLELAAEGCSNREIAKTCKIAESTVKHHLANLFEKTGAGNRVELALFALHHHLVGGQ